MNSTASRPHQALISKLAEGTNGVHAVMFYGLEGVGKRDLARQLAKVWCCLDPTDAAECRACGAFERGTIPDLLTVRPVGASRIIRLGLIVPSKIDEESVPISDFLRTGPLMARHKVVVIEDADRMNGDAANALLKMIEEPPAKVKFVLTTASISRILPTIRSRCLCVAVEASEEMTATVQGIPEEAWNRIDHLARDLKSMHPSHALVAAHRLREAAELIESEDGARTQNAMAVNLLAERLCVHLTPNPEAAIRAVEAHRRIVGNGSPIYQFDALIADILCRRADPSGHRR
jgi:DNA polymerase-3 subunit delta'